MRVAPITALIAGVLAASVSMSAQRGSAGLPLQPTPRSGVTAPTLFPPVQKEHPIGQPVRPPTQDRLKAAVAAALESATRTALSTRRVPPQPAVVCGMRLIPADPNLDPAIRRAVPENGPDFAIRTLVPRICQR
jgi:hypothetical protein